MNAAEKPDDAPKIRQVSHEQLIQGYLELIRGIAHERRWSVIRMLPDGGAMAQLFESQVTLGLEVAKRGEMNEPNPTGLKRFPPDGKYSGIPCTCKPECDDPCNGDCGCEACHMAHGDMLFMIE